MPPLSTFDDYSSSSSSNPNNGSYCLPLEFKPRLDLWSLSGSSSFDSLDKAWAKPAKRSVRFSTETTEVPYIHVTDFTSEEVEAAWYRRSDFRQFRKNREIDTHAMSLPLRKDETRCTAGLETPRESLECQYRIRDAVAVVLEEQNYQRSYNSSYYYEDDHDLLAIAERYGSYAFHCSELARYRGQQQALDAQSQVRNQVACVA